MAGWVRSPRRAGLSPSVPGRSTFGSGGSTGEAALPVPTRTCSAARSTTTRTTDQNNRGSDAWLPQSRVITPEHPDDDPEPRGIRRDPTAGGRGGTVGQRSTDRLEAAAHGRADGGAQLGAPVNQPTNTRIRPEPEHDVLAALEVREQLVEERRARGPEHRAGQLLVHEQLSADGADHRHQHRVRGESCPDDAGHPRTPAPRQHERSEIQSATTTRSHWATGFPNA